VQLRFHRNIAASIKERTRHARKTRKSAYASNRDGRRGISVRTFQEWEQGRRAPSGAARTLSDTVSFRVTDRVIESVTNQKSLQSGPQHRIPIRADAAVSNTAGRRTRALRIAGAPATISRCQGGD
jgi:hypothetical protein